MARQRMDTGRLLLKIKKEIYGENHGNKKHTDQRHHKRRKNPHSTGRLEPVRGTCDFCNGCDNLGGGSVDAFYEPYINGEKELREINEEYRSNSGLVK